MTNKTRLKKVTTALTPSQAILLWLEEAHQYPTMVAYSATFVGGLEHTYPLSRLPDQVEQAVRTALRGQQRDQIERAVREAVRDVVVLYHLHQQANIRLLDHERELALHLGWLSAGLQELLDRNLQRSRLVDVLFELDRLLPYPLEADIAAAVSAAVKHHVESWAAFGEDGTVESWVLAAYLAEGKIELPYAAYRIGLPKAGSRRGRREMDDEAIAALFADESSIADFLAGSDFNYGLADVRDAEFVARMTAVEQALRQLVAGGEVQAGRVVWLETVPVPFLREAPLVQNEWLDRTVVELAEWGTLALKRDFTPIEPVDDHPLAVSGFHDAEGNAVDEAVLAPLRRQAAKLLDRFPGRTRQIDGRPYLHAGDYNGWKGRRLKGKLLVSAEDGFVAASWNGWVAAQGVDGSAQLAGVPVNGVSCYIGGYPFSCRESGVAAEQQARRRALIGSLRSGVGLDEPPAGVDATTQTGTRSFDGLARGWRAQALELLGDAYTHRGFVAELSRRYFAGHELLYANAAQFLSSYIASAERLVDLFNEAIAGPLDGARDDQTPEVERLTLDCDVVVQSCRARIAVAVSGTVDLARAEGLDAIGQTRAAHALVARQLGVPVTD